MAQRRSSQVSNFKHQWRQRNCRVWSHTGALIPLLPPSSSSALGVNSLPSASSSRLPVQRSPGGNRSIIRALTTPLAVPTRTVFDPSMAPKYLPCPIRESRGPKRRLDGCKGIHHTRSPNYTKGRTTRLPTFRSHAFLPSRPTANRRCMLAVYGTRQQIMVCWQFDTRS